METIGQREINDPERVAKRDDRLWPGNRQWMQTFSLTARQYECLCS